MVSVPKKYSIKFMLSCLMFLKEEKKIMARFSFWIYQLEHTTST